MCGQTLKETTFSKMQLEQRAGSKEAYKNYDKKKLYVGH